MARPGTALATATRSARTARTPSCASCAAAAATGNCDIAEPRLAEREEIEAFHRREYVDLVVQKSRDGRGYLDAGDTPAFKGVYEASSFVVGGTLLAVEEIMGARCAPCVHSHRRVASCLARACRGFLRFQ